LPPFRSSFQDIEGAAHALAEEIGIAAELLGRGERDRIDPLLDRDVAGGRKPADPMSERSDKVIERTGGQRSIDPAVPFSQLRVVILRAQHHLERPRAAHEARSGVTHFASAKQF
jgi:hypothetical protein